MSIFGAAGLESGTAGPPHASQRVTGLGEAVVSNLL